MAMRQLLGMAISLGGLLAVTRLLGPASYGTYAVAYGITNYAYLLGQWGINVYLMREPGIGDDDSHQAFTLLLGIGLAAALAGGLLAGVADARLGVAGLRTPLTAMAASIPLQLVTLVPVAALERQLSYKRLAVCELAGQASLYLVAVPCALGGLGVAAPVAGHWAQQLVMAVAVFAAARYRPRLLWHRRRAAAMLRYGLGFSAAGWLWQMRLLVNPLVVAPALGAEAAAVVNVATRLVEALGFARNVTWRIFIPLLGRLQADRGAVAASVEEGMRLQVLAIGAPLLAFALAGPFVVPLTFGADWNGILGLFPYLAVGFLFNCLFNLESSALYVLGRNWQVALFHLGHVTLFAGAALLAAPRLGLPGYGLAELAALAGYGIVHRFTLAAVGPVSLRLGMLWAGGFALALFAPVAGAWAWAGPLAPLAAPQTWQQLGRYWSGMKELQDAH